MTASGRSLPVMVTKRAGQVECKRVAKWSAIPQPARCEPSNEDDQQPPAPTRHPTDRVLLTALMAWSQHGSVEFIYRPYPV